MARNTEEARVPVTEADWLSAISEGCDLPVERVTEVLARHGVRAQSTLPRPRTVRVERVRFSGIKAGTASDGPFSFSWDGLGPGLSGVLSNGNSRGKSSVLNVIRGALQARFPGKIKPDVWKWLGELQVDFLVDVATIRVAMTKDSGEEVAAQGTAIVERLEGGQAVRLYGGPADERLEAQIETLFMEELHLARFFAFNSVKQVVHPHGWPAVSAALFIAEPSKAIFGDQAIDALPLRLVQIFLGLPWISTYTAIQTATKKLQAKTAKAAVEASPATRRNVVSERIAVMEARLAEAKVRLARLPDRADLRKRSLDADKRLGEVQTRLGRVRSELEACKVEHDAASARANRLRRELQEQRDDRAAGLVFRSLRPVCCPVCEAGIDRGRYVEHPTATCVLCGAMETAADAVADDERTQELEAALSDAEGSVERVQVQEASSASRLAALVKDRDGLTEDLAGISAQLDVDDQAVTIEVAALHETLSTLREILTSQNAEGPQSDDPASKVLSVAEAVTKLAFEGRQRAGLDLLSTEVTRLSTLFGVQNLASMRLSGNGVLSIEQGGSAHTYKDLTRGEQLRVRVAASLAVVSVAKVQGYGRHPGLLVLDSPRSEEMSSSDFANLLASVDRAVSDVPGFQIILGAVTSPELDGVVPPDRRREAVDDAYLF